jgi:hypothetical protein
MERGHVSQTRCSGPIIGWPSCTLLFCPCQKRWKRRVTTLRDRYLMYAINSMFN